jgi:hypothetical protein
MTLTSLGSPLLSLALAADDSDRRSLLSDRDELAAKLTEIGGDTRHRWRGAGADRAPIERRSSPDRAPIEPRSSPHGPPTLGRVQADVFLRIAPAPALQSTCNGS